MHPIFRPLQANVAPVSIPRAMGTALFLHRMKTQLKPPTDGKAGQLHANGHPIIHQPIVVRPARPTHTTSTQLY